MKFAFSQEREKGEELLVVPFWEGAKAAADYGSLKLSAPLKDFSGKNGETALCYEGHNRILLLGLGKQEKATVEVLRRAYAAAVKVACSKKIKHMAVLFPKCKQKEQFLQGMAEGILLTNYSFTYKSDSATEGAVNLLEQVTWIGIAKTPFLDELQTIAQGVYFIRNLVNANADGKVDQLLKEAKHLHPKVKTTVFDKKKLEAEKMGLILAVNRGSSEDPCLIQAAYKGNPKSKLHVVLVGKGVTYDTGGLSLKTSDGMSTMKCDMAAAATVLSAVKTAAELGLKINVTALAPIVENSIGPNSFKVGDVYRSYSGKTVEVTNTDGEGRLILADALGYAVKELKPSCIVDLATLTGSCVIALGEEIAALFANDEELADDLMGASERSDELLCQMPLYADYLEAYKSDIADIVNSAGREGGAIKAALFLKEFVGETPWAHLDIAGPAYLSKPKHYNPFKGTGYGLRLLIEFLMRKSAQGVE